MSSTSKDTDNGHAPDPSPDESIPSATNTLSTRSVLWKLYLSHALSTWNARTFEFSAVIFLASIFPSTLFYASCYALFRSLTAFLLSSAVGHQVDSRERLSVVRHSIIWQRVSVAASCGILLLLLRSAPEKWTTVAWFSVCVVLAGAEKLAFVGNTVAVERDWVVVISEGLSVPREDLNSKMRRIDLVCKLVAPLGISLVDGYSTEVAICVVLGQNTLSVIFEYFAIAHVYHAVPGLASRKGTSSTTPHMLEGRRTALPNRRGLPNALRQWRAYFMNPACLASFSLALLYFTVLGFGSQLTTYLLTLGFTSTHTAGMRLISVILELSATCAAPLLMRRIGAVRAGLWFINYQLITVLLAISLFTLSSPSTQTAGLILVAGVTLSRLGLWGFDLCVQYLVQEDAPEATRGSFSAIEASLQNLFELCSFATTMVWARPEQFRFPVWVSGGVLAVSAACFAAFVRAKRGHLLHTSRCLRKRGGRYKALPTIQEESEVELDYVGRA
ncbi:hypothetical protein P171DRAFT_377693 [Karstenula rhodostoma CBS 690.94]|uniref:Solute carrier family 40 member n=1 Tax=Karstenula rhodostoma CBS 690.94 TaxID=1392251 RepID=A0A9P4PXC8_9PLEO|nr:hypothetical protein P171DRAFT_377693 [Karstenula rhodostoma CBS 690.94]